MSCNLETNLSLQLEELEALKSIYGEDFVLEDEEGRTFSIVIHVGEEEGQEGTIVLTFPEGYPLDTKPIFHLSIPWVRGQQKQVYISALEELYLEHAGENIVFNLVEKLKMLLKNRPESLEAVQGDSAESKSSTKEEMLEGEGTKDVPNIVTGEPLTDRKSTFQAHVAPVKHLRDIKLVLQQLNSNKKIASATHNMYAYRIYNEESGNWQQDCEDDGETHAGSRLLHLLQILDCKNVLIVVSRWYGGVFLYGDRFKHINNVARELLHSEGFIRQPPTKKQSSK